MVAERYRLAEQIGRGAMGTVWRARDELLDRDVAVKEVRVPSSVSQEERDNSYQRTLREARTAARLSHPGVAAVYDVVEENGRPWIVMELVNGRSLDQVVTEDGPLSPRAAARLGRQVLAALAAAHMAGVLHRDVKPSNVIVDDRAPGGRIVLTDFGIATAEGDPSLTQTGMVMGSPGFLAPERIRGAAATPASDLWSLGATLYAAVEGKGPYERHGGVMTTMAAVVTEDPPQPRSCWPLAPVIGALLNRDPARRPSAAAVARMLEAVDGGALDGGALDGGAAAESAPAESAAANGAAADGAGGASGGDHGGDEIPGRNGAVVAQAAGRGGGPGAGDRDGAEPHGTLPLMQTLQPSAVLPPGTPIPAQGAAPGAPAGWGSPSMAPVATYTPAAAPMSPHSAGPAPVGPWAAYAPARPLPPRRASRSPHRHRIITFVIIGAAIFLAAAAAASQINPERSAGSAGTGAGHSAAAGGGSHASGTTHVRRPARRLPAGFRLYSQPPGAAGAGSAGFSVAVPRGWRVSRAGRQTVIKEPGGSRFLEVDLTPHRYPGMVAELMWLQQRTRLARTFPGYQLLYIHRVSYQGTVAADWAFTWNSQTSGPTDVRDRAWIARGPGGAQSFAIYWSAPAVQWDRSRSVLAEALRTFTPVW
jgi:tRNA A-37 threonylcarbamoyl transferase component Bud32